MRIQHQQENRTVFLGRRASYCCHAVNKSGQVESDKSYRYYIQVYLIGIRSFKMHSKLDLYNI